MRRIKPAKSLEAARFLLLKRRIQRYLPRRPLATVGYLGLAGGLAVIAIGTIDLMDRGSRLSNTMVAATAAFGLTVQDIDVSGRSMTDAQEILKILDAKRGTAILSISPSRTRQDLEALPWVKTASVERRLPGTLYISLTERTPLALWQRHGEIVLIDEEGTPIKTDRLERFADKLMVVGEDAPQAAAPLIATLATNPALMKRIQAAVRVGGRRWNLHMDSGVDVELPETDIAVAWTRLGEIERDHGLLARDIETVDLRMADRVVVKKAPEIQKAGTPVSSKPKPKTVATKST